MGTGASVGEAVIASVTNATTLVLHSAQHITYDGVVAGETYEIRQKPLSTLGTLTIVPLKFLVIDTTEQGVVNALAGSNDKRKYAPPHAGWVGISSYTDMHGNFRVKTETRCKAASPARFR